jgi:hypothetical protein
MLAIRQIIHTGFYLQEQENRQFLHSSARISCHQRTCFHYQPPSGF